MLSKNANKLETPKREETIHSQGVYDSEIKTLHGQTSERRKQLHVQCDNTKEIEKNELDITPVIASKVGSSIYQS